MFNIRDIKLNIVVIVAVLVLMAFFGGKYLLNKYNVEQPLIDELQALNGIDNVKLVDNNDKTEITVSLDHNVDFYNLYQKIDSTASSQLGPDNYNIVFADESNQHLNQVYYNMHYALYEGMATKKFTVMQKQIVDIVAKNNLSDYDLWIDNNNLYLKLVDNDNCLYKIIPRNQFSLTDIQGGANSG